MFFIQKPLSITNFTKYLSYLITFRLSWNYDWNPLLIHRDVLFLLLTLAMLCSTLWILELLSMARWMKNYWWSFIVFFEILSIIQGQVVQKHWWSSRTAAKTYNSKNHFSNQILHACFHFNITTTTKQIRISNQNIQSFHCFYFKF